MNRFVQITLLICMVFAVNAGAEDQSYPFKDPAEEQRFRQLTEELRCLVCQNQSLADSDAPLANDLRREVYEMMQDGRDNGAIIDFLVARYGEFVLYKPRLNTVTLLLWAAPVLLLLLGLVVLYMLSRRRSDQLQVSDSDRQRVREMLEED